MCSKFSFLHADASSSRMLDHPSPSSRMVRLHFFFSKVRMFRFFSKVRCTFSSLRCGWTSTSRLSTANCAPSPKKIKLSKPSPRAENFFPHSQWSEKSCPPYLFKGSVLLALQWCGCTFSFLRCGYTSTSCFLLQIVPHLTESQTFLLFFFLAFFLFSL